MQLRTLLSDVGHTAFSHLGDWMFQTEGTSEDLHDKELKDILEITGVADLLAEYGISVDEVVFPDVQDWVEAPAPDLNVDRVDYGIREMLRWQSSFTGINYFKSKLANPQKLFAIDDNDRLTIKDPDFASRFAIGYSLLPTEHWAHPVHRLQLQLFQLTMRRILVDRVDNGGGHPREALYDVDAGFASDFTTWDVMNLVNTMKAIGLSQRRIFIQGRKPDLESIFRSANEPFGKKMDRKFIFPEFPDPLEMLTWESKEFIVPHAPNLIVESSDVQAGDPLTVSTQGLRFALPALKARSVDPVLMRPGGKTVRLSEFNPSYEPYLEGQRREMAKNYLITILMHPDFAQSIVKKDAEAVRLWKELLQRPRSADRLKEKIENAGEWGAAHHLDPITDW